ncbi:histidine kinase [Corallococcus exiguus]|uniref:sensor histidine kinase n=1 Tax=Corallococcus TaxID=83461 RepID=UPI000EB8C6DF|nr:MULTISPECIES: ATP-binding protein [Corallococcus]NNC21298.1 histidine kinase [Corallococcus exiguus]NRD43697.1 histidine kinase [Corallococcus exiguus]NRD53675.1 histidine kinase [Corallococcus exiguus]RKI18902.1 histidine kinase [Corallococcus sp. AB030]RUO87543.1 histidine kinase [Corallococcus sp. AB018]
MTLRAKVGRLTAMTRRRGTLRQAFERLGPGSNTRCTEETPCADNRLLEETVRERTAALEAANAKLSSSLEQLHATQTQLLFADRLIALGRIAAGVGHEINNPLAFILSNLEYIHQELQQKERLSEQDRQEILEALAETRDGAERIRLIVRDLQTLSRAEDVGSGPAELAAVVRTAAKMAMHELRHRARLVVECDGVPPVQGNGSRLGQVFLNLLLNAAQSISPGNAEGNEVRVVARPGEPGHVLVEVRDTGCGIEPEHRERIFDPFFTTKPLGVGTGLGLAVCHGIVTSLGGTLTMESAPGRGSVFRVTLPVAGAFVQPQRPQADWT